VGESTARWYAVYTKPRQERIALLNLERQHFECFLPLADNPYQRRRPRRLRSEPLFPRYLFLKARPACQSLATVRSTRGVVGLVRMGFELIEVPPGIIAALMARRHPISGLIALDPVPLRKGEAVRVFDGPLAGTEGVLKEHYGPRRSVLLLKILGRDTTVEVDSLLLQRAG